MAIALTAPLLPEPVPLKSTISTTIPAGQRYVDQVLDDTPLRITTASAPGPDAKEPAGRRFMGVDYKLYARDSTGAGRSTEQGLALRYRRETLDFGELHFDGELRNYRPSDRDTLPERTLGNRYTLSQYRYALTERWQMDSALGMVRSNVSPLIGNSFRLQLPSSVMRGMSGTLQGADSEWRFSSGQLGKLSGVAAQELDIAKGSLHSIGYTRRVDGNWSLGAMVNSLDGHDTVASHQSAAGVAQYWSSDRQRRFQLRALTDSKGRAGAWFDADEKYGPLQNRYGVYRIDPNTLWTDVVILNDQQGAYWRSDYRMPRYTLAGGADFTDNNIRNDTSRPGNRTASGFVSGFWRLDRTLNWNANASISHGQPKFNVPGAASSTTSNLNTAVAKTLDWGVTRVQLTHTQTDSAVIPAREDTVRWDHDWSPSSTRHFSTILSHTWATNNGADSTRATAGLVFRHMINPSFRWDGNLSFTRVNDSLRSSDNNINAAINGAWNFNRDWSAQLQLIWNRIDNTNPAAPVYTRDRTVLLTLRYEISGGTPLPQTGLATGGLGTGRISGRVFFDDNGDGLRQATERPVAGLTVLLDGRYRAITDNEGRFEFGPVPTGTHEITVQVERVPLPWGLLDESPRRANVPLRGEAVVEIPLNKLNQ